MRRTLYILGIVAIAGSQCRLAGFGWASEPRQASIDPTLRITNPLPDQHVRAGTNTINKENQVPTGNTSDFTGDFAIPNWTLVNTPPEVAGGFITDPGPPIELFVIGGDATIGGDTDFQITVPEDGVIMFDWGYETVDIDCFDSGGYVIDGTYTPLACNADAVPFFTQQAMVPVSQGQTFAFRVFTDDGLEGNGTLGVTNFQFQVSDAIFVNGFECEPGLDGCPAACEPTQILDDPSFEATDPNTFVNPFWDSTSTNFGSGLCTTAFCGTGNGTAGPRTGEFWVWLGGTANPETGTAQQTVTIPAGSNRYLNYWLWIGSVGAGATMTVQVDGNVVQTVDEPGAAEPGYAQRSVDVSAYADGGSHTVLFEYVSSGGASSNFALDDVTLECTPPN